MSFLSNSSIDNTEVDDLDADLDLEQAKKPVTPLNRNARRAALRKKIAQKRSERTGQGVNFDSVSKKLSSIKKSDLERMTKMLMQNMNLKESIEKNES